MPYFHCFAGCTGGAIMAALRDLRLNPKIRARDLVETSLTGDRPANNGPMGMARPVAGTLAERY
jgi:hypothetical protein